MKNDDKLQDYFNLIKILKSDENIELKLIELKLNSYDMKTNKSIYNKIRIIRNFEEEYKLGFMKYVVFEEQEFKQFDEKLYESIKAVLLLIRLT